MERTTIKAPMRHGAAAFGAMLWLNSAAAAANDDPACPPPPEVAMTTRTDPALPLPDASALLRDPFPAIHFDPPAATHAAEATPADVAAVLARALRHAERCGGTRPSSAGAVPDAPTPRADAITLATASDLLTCVQHARAIPVTAGLTAPDAPSTATLWSMARQLEFALAETAHALNAAPDGHGRPASDLPPASAAALCATIASLLDDDVLAAMTAASAHDAQRSAEAILRAVDPAGRYRPAPDSADPSAPLDRAVLHAVRRALAPHAAVDAPSVTVASVAALLDARCITAELRAIHDAVRRDAPTTTWRDVEHLLAQYPSVAQYASESP